jgi:hypothetical protein
MFMRGGLIAMGVLLLVGACALFLAGYHRQRDRSSIALISIPVAVLGGILIRRAVGPKGEWSPRVRLGAILAFACAFSAAMFEPLWLPFDLSKALLGVLLVLGLAISVGVVPISPRRAPWRAAVQILTGAAVVAVGILVLAMPYAEARNFPIVGMYAWIACFAAGGALLGVGATRLLARRRYSAEDSLRRRFGFRFRSERRRIAARMGRRP